jgi:hypothetical protein
VIALAERGMEEGAVEEVSYIYPILKLNFQVTTAEMRTDEENELWRNWKPTMIVIQSKYCAIVKFIDV